MRLVLCSLAFCLLLLLPAAAFAQVGVMPEKATWYCKTCSYTIKLPHGETPGMDCPQCQKRLDEIVVDRTYSRVLVYGGIAAIVGLIALAIWQVVARFHREEAEAKAKAKKKRALEKRERKQRLREMKEREEGEE